jgi:hypothetical protein
MVQFDQTGINRECEPENQGIVRPSEPTLRERKESIIPMATHPQTWIKVNAPVDIGVAEIVSILNSVDGLETLQSCQGEPGDRDGYVYFSCGDWKKLSQLVFEQIGPSLKRNLDEEATLTVEATDTEEPMAKLSFRAEASGMVVSALKEVLRYERP